VGRERGNETGGKGDAMERKRIRHVELRWQREATANSLCSILLDLALVLVDVLGEGSDGFDRISAEGWSTPEFQQREN
jgi:hypothetical protein